MSDSQLSFIPPIIAHRGASALAPENTLAAFLKAKQLGLHWVEFDVMLASTGEAIAMHDDTLERTTNGQGRVIDCSYDYLKTLDAGSWFHPDFFEERIPLLEDVLKLLQQQELAANLEIKSLSGYEEVTVQRIVDILKKNFGLNNTEQPLLISSFSPIILKITKKLLPSASLSVLMDEWHSDWQDFCEEIQAVTVNINHRILTPERTRAIKQKNYKVLAYTVNTAERAHELFSWGVDAVFSDCLTGFDIQRV
ncbi:MAG: ugpQ [Gammaproteobacteria bacterium]|jgi:glycerophosphoryl diester phosphodiesterase|nr:ugpQ [Gammaproteobacteria bacterium]